ncbi:MAG: hypothetical protein A4E62_02152 [Syntrophorhabdus sp. PtaU1.Bin002]|nr:MAG: hypothetical protein A4E58_01802 [Syntrophorhabdus sp. PtaB.Bin006]OPY67935.1 MAG: hypothetical protein A4E62_02152 [Syntrophorhabdus sp. PtaU1.Bin002]
MEIPLISMIILVMLVALLLTVFVGRASELFFLRFQEKRHAKLDKHE